jgi:hypothetical protein
MRPLLPLPPGQSSSQIDVSSSILSTADRDCGGSDSGGSSNSGRSADSSTHCASTSCIATMSKVENEEEKEKEKEEDDAPADLFHILEKVRCGSKLLFSLSYPTRSVLHLYRLIACASSSLMYAD